MEDLLNARIKLQTKQVGFDIYQNINRYIEYRSPCIDTHMVSKKLTDTQPYRLPLTLSQTSPDFYVSVIQVF